ncbi:ran-binding protein [Xylaria bambusicola]|uniref:ran-binding protein n=1 Tax=Xylaria bambusicola TaxID=326684 RepID=UPI00200721AA|nr:ran-binding protein [Xylaria bambusicola]KAI0521934.1 ran-binding protein [Xylaria bambusicola]
MNPDGTYPSFVPRVGNFTSIVSGSNLTLASPSIRSNRVSYLLNPASESTSDLYSTLPSSRSSMLDAERTDHTPDGGISSMASRPPQLPSFSRAFEMFMPRGGLEEPWTTGQDNTGFFIPSYLKGSPYITKLEEVHREKEAQNDSQQTSGASLSAASLDSPLSKTPASHLGMTYDLIERIPPLDHTSSVAPLPTRWNIKDKFGAIEVSANGLEVKYNPTLRTTREQDHEMCGIRADHPMPTQAGIYYFEVTLLSKRRDETTTVSLGFLAKNVSLARPPGWEPDSYGFHGDDGEIYSGGNVGKKYKDTTFSAGDVIGCGVNFRTGQAFFTKNGANLGTAFRDIKGKQYPAVGIKKAGELIRVNFGQNPFVFKIDQVIEREQAMIKQAISRTSVEKLISSRMNETELIQQLVLQFLQHDGYVETAREFAQEIHAEQHALNSGPNVPVMNVNIKDDDDAHQRQRIRRAVLEGDIDRALALTNTHYARVLKNNQDVYFKLKCRKFIEMIRKAAENSNGNGKGRNGHPYDDNHNEMDVDENDLSDTLEDESMESQADPGPLLKETIAYGQALQAEFRDDKRREVSKALNDIFALLAYPNPLQVKEVAHMLDRKGRVAVAEELNSAILSSLGKSSRSALENLYGQTSVLLDYLREDGGPGSLISIQSVIDEIPKSQLF